MKAEEDHREERRPLSGKKVYGLFILLVVVSGTLWFGAIQWKDHLTVSGIIVDGERILTKEEVVKLSQISLKTKMYDVDLMAIQKNIRKNHYVRNAAVTRDAPSTIRISVEERTPLALLLLPGKGELLAIDGEGYVLPHVASQAIYDLPVVSGIDSENVATVGEQTRNADVRAAIEALEAARLVSSELYHMISEVRTRSGHDMVLYSADTGVPIIFGRGDAVKKMVKLDEFWKEFVSERGLQDFKYIDVRFDDQVVVSSNSKKAS